jgi:hypothetical protein
LIILLDKKAKMNLKHNSFTDVLVGIYTLKRKDVSGAYLEHEAKS